MKFQVVEEDDEDENKTSDPPCGKAKPCPWPIAGGVVEHIETVQRDLPLAIFLITERHNSLRSQARHHYIKVRALHRCLFRIENLLTGITSVSSAHLNFLTAADQVRPKITTTTARYTRLMMTRCSRCKISTTRCTGLTVTRCRLLLVRTSGPLLSPRCECER